MDRPHLADLVILLVLVLAHNVPNVGQNLSFAQSQVIVKIQQQLAVAHADRCWQLIGLGCKSADSLQVGMQDSVNKHGNLVHKLGIPE